MPVLSVLIKDIIALTVFKKKRLKVCCFASTFCCVSLLSATPLSAQQPVSAFAAPEQPQISFAVAEDSSKAPQQLQNVAQAFRQLPVPIPKSTEVQSAAFKTLSSDSVSESGSESSSEDGSKKNTEECTEKNAKDETLLDKPLAFGKSEKNKDVVQKPKLSSQFTPLISVIGSLLIVLSAFLCMALLFKKFARQTGRALPSEAFENLGKTNLSPKIQLQLLRLGNRLILVSVSSDGVSPITEITDPDEVVPLLGMCRKQDKNSATALFRKTLSEVVNPETENTDYFGGGKTSVIHKSGGRKPSVNVRSSHLDLISEPDGGLADILANGIPVKGGRYA